jgi:hypothetical protein
LTDPWRPWVSCTFGGGRAFRRTGEFAKVQSCRKTGDSRATVLAVKHISKSRLICSTNIKRTLRRVRRVGVEIRAMQVIDSP